MSECIQAAITKCLRLGGLYTIETYFPQFWSLGSSRLSPQHIRCLLRAHFLVHGQLSSLCPHMMEWFRELCLFYKNMMPFMRALLSRPNHILKAPLQAITFGLGFNQYILGVGGTQHSVYCDR